MGRDQNDNVARATRHRGALSFKPSAPPAAIAQAVQRLLEDPMLRRSAESFGARIRSDANTPELVDELEALDRANADNQGIP
jgi:UDP:flavonoid glycosyltransferase YjiC (YdhE family)